MLTVRCCIGTSRLRAARRQARLIHHRNLVCSTRIHRIRIGVLRRIIRILRIRIRVTHFRRLVIQRDRQLGGRRIPVRIAQCVGKHIVHATLGGRRIAHIAVAAVCLDRQHAVQALHHGIARRRHVLALCACHMAHRSIVGTLGVTATLAMAAHTRHHVAGHGIVAALGHHVIVVTRHRHAVLHIQVKFFRFRFAITIRHGKADLLQRHRVLLQAIRVRHRLQQRHHIGISHLAQRSIRLLGAYHLHRQDVGIAGLARQRQAIGRYRPLHVLAQCLQLRIQTVCAQLDRLQQVTQRHITAVVHHQLALGHRTLDHRRTHHAHHRCRWIRQTTLAHCHRRVVRHPDPRIRLQRDIHRGRGLVTVAILDGVGEAVCRAGRAGTCVRRVGELARGRVIAHHTLVGLGRDRHLARSHAIGTTHIVGQRIDDDGLAFHLLRCGIIRCRRHIVHDTGCQRSAGGIAIVVLEHHRQVLEQRIGTRCMRLGRLQHIAVAHHTSAGVVARHRQLIAQRRHQLGTCHQGTVLDELGAANRQALHAILALDRERGIATLCQAGRVRTGCQRLLVHRHVAAIGLGRQAADLRLVVRRRRFTTTAPAQ